MVKLYWPISNASLNDWREQLGLQIEGNGTTGYNLAIQDKILRYSMLRQKIFHLVNGGRTEAIKIEFVPIPPPKTRLETRWNRGRWERLTKAKGWVPA